MMITKNFDIYFISSPFEPFVPNQVELGLFAKALDTNRATVMTTLKNLNSTSTDSYISSPKNDFLIGEFIRSISLSYNIYTGFDTIYLHGAPFHDDFPDMIAFLSFIYKLLGSDLEIYAEDIENKNANFLYEMDFSTFLIRIPTALNKELYYFFSSTEFLPYDDIKLLLLMNS